MAKYKIVLASVATFFLLLFSVGSALACGPEPVTLDLEPVKNNNSYYLIVKLNFYPALIERSATVKLVMPDGVNWTSDKISIYPLSSSITYLSGLTSSYGRVKIEVNLTESDGSTTYEIVRQTEAYTYNVRVNDTPVLSWKNEFVVTLLNRHEEERVMVVYKTEMDYVPEPTVTSQAIKKLQSLGLKPKSSDSNAEVLAGSDTWGRVSGMYSIRASFSPKAGNYVGPASISLGMGSSNEYQEYSLAYVQDPRTYWQSHYVSTGTVSNNRFNTRLDQAVGNFMLVGRTIPVEDGRRVEAKGYVQSAYDYKLIPDVNVALYHSQPDCRSTDYRSPVANVRTNSKGEWSSVVPSGWYRVEHNLGEEYQGVCAFIRDSYPYVSAQLRVHRDPFVLVEPRTQSAPIGRKFVVSLKVKKTATATQSTYAAEFNLHYNFEELEIDRVNLFEDKHLVIRKDWREPSGNAYFVLSTKGENNPLVDGYELGRVTFRVKNSPKQPFDTYLKVTASALGGPLPAPAGTEYRAWEYGWVVPLIVYYDGDANYDGAVTIIDFSILAGEFGKSCQGSCQTELRADFNEDGVVNVLDFSLLANNFNKGSRRRGVG